MKEAVELCEEAIQVCYEYINKKCSGCFLKPLCQDWNKNYTDIDNRDAITSKINATFIKQEKPKPATKEIKAEPKKQVSESIKKLASKRPVAKNELF